MIQGTAFGFYTAESIEEMEAYSFPNDTTIICVVESSPSVTFKGINGVFGQIDLPSLTGNNDKYLRIVDGVLVWAAAGGGTFSGTMDDIDDGSTYVKTENNYTDAEVTKLAGIATAATANSSDATLLNTDNHTNGTTNKVYTAVEKTKLAGVATSASANSSDATLLNTDNHTDGSTNKVFSATNKTKLAGIATGATANDTDANLKNTDNHTDGSTNKVYSATDKTKLAGISAGAQVNSAITKAEIEAKLTGLIASHAHDYAAPLGSDDNYVTDVEKVVIGNTSNINTGDETGATIRTKLGTTTVGAAINILTNPSAITFLRVNADNTVTARSAANFLSDIGAQTATELPMVKMVSTANQTITAGYASIIPYKYTIGNGFITAIGDISVLQIT